MYTLMNLSLLSLFTVVLTLPVFAQDAGAYSRPEITKVFESNPTKYINPYPDAEALALRNKRINTAILEEQSPEDIKNLAYLLVSDTPEEPKVSSGEVFLKLEDDPRFFAHITISYTDYDVYGDADNNRAIALARELAKLGKKILFKLDGHQYIPASHIKTVLPVLMEIGQLDKNAELMRSAHGRRFDLVKYFLDLGANVQIAEVNDLCGASTLKLCCDHKHLCNQELENALLKAGAKSYNCSRLRGGRRNGLFDF